MHVRVFVLGRGQIPDSNGYLCRGGNIGVGDGQLKPLIPYARILKGLVRSLHGYGKRLAVRPYLGGNVKLKVRAVILLSAIHARFEMERLSLT